MNGALAARFLRPGFIRSQLRKVWDRARFRLLALGRPLTTLHRHRALSGKVVVVYTMGKVGSSSVYYTLMKTFPFRRIRHVHFLSRHWLEERLPGTPFTRNIALARAAEKAIHRPDRQSLYIVMMRDPIARDLSNVIQNHVENGIDIVNLPIDQVVRRIHEDGHGFGQEWFDTDFLGFIGRPVTAFPFDPDRGYAISELHNGDKVMLLTVEKMDDVFDRAMSELLGVSVDAQYVFNESGKKAEGAFYAELKQAYRLPQTDLDGIYSAPAVKHFYSDDQIAAIKSKWVQK